MTAKKVLMFGLSSMPVVKAGDDIANLILDSIEKDDVSLENGSVIVIAQKVVSIAENAIQYLKDVIPSPKALELSQQTGRDARLCQVYLNESNEIFEVKGRMVIAKHKLGFVCSGAGVDRSNVAPHEDECVVLLPVNPDHSALKIRAAIYKKTGKTVAVIINDSFGRDDRDGSIGLAIGISGINYIDERTQKDLFGNPSNSRIALVDELAAGASILMGQANEKIPVVVVNGVQYQKSENSKLISILNPIRRRERGE